MTTKFKTAPSGRIVLAPVAAHAVPTKASPPVAGPTDDQALHQDSAGESAGRASDSPAVQHAAWDPISEEDEVDRELEKLGIGRQPMLDWDPRAVVSQATSMSNIELGDLLVRLSAENDRVSRLHARQQLVVDKLRYELRDREVQVRRSASNASLKLDDLVWSDEIYRRLRDAALLQQRVLDELKADVGALERHHASISRLVEIRRQEQERDLIDVNVPSRRPFGRWGASR